MTTRTQSRPDNQRPIQIPRRRESLLASARSDDEIARQMRERGSINPARGRFNRRERVDIVLELAGNGCALISAHSQSGASYLSRFFGDATSVWFCRDRVVRHQVGCDVLRSLRENPDVRIKVVTYTPELPQATQSE